MIKFLRYFFYTIIFLLISFIVLIQMQFVKDYAIETIQEVVLEKTGQQIEIEEIKLFPSFQLSAKGVKVLDGEKQWLEIDLLHFGISPFIAIQDGYLHFHKIHLDGIRLKEPPKGDSEQEISFDALPIRIDIDSLTILNFQFEESDPIDIRGNLFIQPEKESITANLRVNRISDKNQVAQALLTFLKDKGKFRVEIPGVSSLEGKFKLPADSIIDITNIKSVTGPIKIEGRISVGNDWKFSKVKFKMESGDLSELFPVQGKVAGEASLKGHITQPILNLNLFSNKIVSGDQTFEQINIGISSHPLVKGIGGKFSLSVTKDGHPYHFQGAMKWDTPFSPQFTTTLKLSDTLDLLDVDTSNIKGDLAINVDLSSVGPLAEFKILNGSYESYVLGCKFNQINANLAIHNNELLISKLTGKSRRNGTFSGSGKMSIDHANNYPFNLKLDVDKVFILDRDNLKTQATGELELTGNIEEATLNGTLNANRVTFNLPEKSKQITDTLNVTYINQPDSETPPTPFKKKKIDWPLNFNITVNARRNVSIQGSGLTSEWGGNVVINGRPNELLVNGELKIREGMFIFRGKKFTLNKGTITFDGDIEKKTTLYTIAELELDGLTAEVIVKGPVKNPAISFRSNPAKSQREILSWILFNKGLNEISDFQGTQLNDSISDLIKESDSSPDILSRVQNSLGIDRIEIGGPQDGEPDGMTVQVGKYLSNGTFLTLTRKTSQDTSRSTEANSVGIETALFKNIKLQAEVDDGGNGQANLIWRRDY